MTNHKEKISKSFSNQALAYDYAAEVQWQSSEKLHALITKNLTKPPKRILEIGCGTGFLSSQLIKTFPDANFIFTDIAPSMLERCKAKLGEGYEYRLLDGESPDNLVGEFDLIASNLAFQWFVDLQSGLSRLSSFLSKEGSLIFSTLGENTFQEWRKTHEKFGLLCGTPLYPSSHSFPWPDSYRHELWETIILHSYESGEDFIRTLKALGASEPIPGYRPLPPGSFKKILADLNQGVDITYHLLFGKINH
jgi:malonyl-CoA O-methyltransferase